MSDLRRLVAVLDRNPVQTRADLVAMGGEFYRIGEEEWCDTAGASYRRMGADRWVNADLPAMAQPGMNTGEGESLESSVSVFTVGCGFESHWQEFLAREVILPGEPEDDFRPIYVPDVLP